MIETAESGLNVVGTECKALNKALDGGWHPGVSYLYGEVQVDKEVYLTQWACEALKQGRRVLYTTADTAVNVSWLKRKIIACLNGISLTGCPNDAEQEHDLTKSHSKLLRNLVCRNTLGPSELLGQIEDSGSEIVFIESMAYLLPPCGARQLGSLAKMHRHLHNMLKQRGVCVVGAMDMRILSVKTGAKMNFMPDPSDSSFARILVETVPAKNKILKESVAEYILTVNRPGNLSLRAYKKAEDPQIKYAWTPSE